MRWTSSRAMCSEAGGAATRPGLEDMERAFDWDQVLGLIPAISASGVVILRPVSEVV